VGCAVSPAHPALVDQAKIYIRPKPLVSAMNIRTLPVVEPTRSGGIIEDWRQHYSMDKPHSWLAYHSNPGLSDPK